MGNTNSNPPPYEPTSISSSDKRVISHEKLNAKTQIYIDKIYNKALSKAINYINKCVLEEAEAGSKQFEFSPGHIRTTNTSCTCCCSNSSDSGWDKSCIGVWCCSKPCLLECHRYDSECCCSFPCCGAFCCKWFKISRKSTVSQIPLTFKDKTLEAKYYKKLCDEIVDILQKQKINAYIDTQSTIKINYGIPGYVFHNVIVIKW
jgi:hypothetical protein